MIEPGMIVKHTSGKVGEVIGTNHGAALVRWFDKDYMEWINFSELTEKK